MPIFRFDNKALIRFVQHLLVLLTVIIAMYLTTTLNTNSSLHRRMMPMSTTYGIINSIYIENTLYLKRYYLLYHRHVSSPVRVCR